MEIRDRLRNLLGDLHMGPARTPVGQLVKSLISGRTRDPVSLHAYERLIQAYDGWPAVAAASAEELEAVIAEVTFAEVKSRQLTAALRTIGADRPDFDLTFLAGQPVPDALAWLESFWGVGRKVAASVLNFSTLGMPAFVIDTHVLRVLRRFGLASPRAEVETVYETMMAATAGWRAEDLAQLHLLLKRLGQTLCQAHQVHCDPCPLRECCRTGEVSGRPRCPRVPGGRPAYP